MGSATGLTPKQTTSLQQLLEIGSDNALPGSWLKDESVPPSKIDGQIPDSKIAAVSAGKITGILGPGQFVELDPLFLSSPASSISGADIANWSSAFSWGNHASAGYLTSAPSARKDVFVATAGQTIFTLSAAPAAANLAVQQGLALREGPGFDYVISGTTFTLAVGASVGDVVQVFYTA